MYGYPFFTYALLKIPGYHIFISQSFNNLNERVDDKAVTPSFIKTGGSNRVLKEFFILEARTTDDFTPLLLEKEMSQNSFNIATALLIDSAASSLLLSEFCISWSTLSCMAKSKSGIGSLPTIASVINGCTPPVAYFQKAKFPILEAR